MADEGGAEISDKQIKYKSPLGVTADEDDCPENFVRVCVVFPGLKKKLLSSEASNGTVDIKFETRSFTLTLAMKKKDTIENYRYVVERFPDDVIPEKCYNKVKKDQVILYLCKEKPRSWAGDLANTGIETFREEEHPLDKI